MSKQKLQEDVQQWRQVFNLFDKDGDGIITSTEVKSVMKNLGYDASDDQVSAMINKVDKDGNGIIDFEEFVDMMIKKRKHKQQSEDELDLRKIFEDFDQDGSGYITSSELQTAMAKIGLRMSGSEVRKMMSEADCNGDGKISFEEFAKMLSEQV